MVANAYFRTRRFIGSGDRRAVADRVWGILRRYGQLFWWLERTRHPDRSARGIGPQSKAGKYRKLLRG